MTTIDRMNDLAVESTSTWIDSVSLAQRGSVTVAQSVLSAVEQNQETTRALATTMLKQAQEGQRLWTQFVQEWFRTASDTAASVSQNQVSHFNETVNSVKAQAAGADKRAATGVNSK